MPDRPSTRGRPARAHINVKEEQEILFWTKELGISEERLKEIVSRIGTSPSKVREAARQQ